MNDPLICPICRTPLTKKGNSYYCEKERPHCFDIARSGYVTLTAAGGHAGDDREMVRARTAFLEKDYYRPFADAVCRLLENADIIIDAGCGEGYYTNLLASAGDSQKRQVYGFDLSKSACDHAAKRAKVLGTSAFFGVSSLFSLPIADGTADAVVSLFAPIAEKEFSRVLKPGGYLLIGAAGKRHLFELKEALYEHPYENEERRDLPEQFSLLSKETLTYSFLCPGEDLKHLFFMTPYAFKTSPEDTAKLDLLESLRVTASFDLFLYQKKDML